LNNLTALLRPIFRRSAIADGGCRLLHTYSWISGNGGLFDFSDPELTKVMTQVFDPKNRVTR
jgi:hypothetical protein